MQSFTVRLTGTTDLIMQSERLVNPLDEIRKEIKTITDKRTKQTEADHARRARLEFEASLYFDEEMGPVIPSLNILASFRDGGRMARTGTDVERALHATKESVKLLYKGPRNTDDLWKAGFHDIRGVNTGTRTTPKKVMRCRPRFKNWSLETVMTLEEDQLDLDRLRQAAENAGNYVGIGTARRLGMGRYKVEITPLSVKENGKS